MKRYTVLGYVNPGDKTAKFLSVFALNIRHAVELAEKAFTELVCVLG